MASTNNSNETTTIETVAIAQVPVFSDDIFDDFERSYEQLVEKYGDFDEKKSENYLTSFSFKDGEGFYFFKDNDVAYFYTEWNNVPDDSYFCYMVKTKSESLYPDLEDSARVDDLKNSGYLKYITPQPCDCPNPHGGIGGEIFDFIYNLNDEKSFSITINSKDSYIFTKDSEVTINLIQNNNN